MPSPATSTVVKEAATALPTPHATLVLLSAFCVGVQTTVRRFLQSHPITDRTLAPDVAPDALPTARTHAAPAFISEYHANLNRVWHEHDWSDVVELVEALRLCWRENRQVFLCGNGGSAANAVHLANDYLYGVAKNDGRGLRVTALPANAAVLTCLANDISYDDVFAQQLSVLAQPGDLLLAFSGSGNSPNIVKALTRARELGVKSFAILGFSGGRALELADHPIHFPIDDMQIAEDLQMMIGHMAMQHLSKVGR